MNKTKLAIISLAIGVLLSSLLVYMPFLHPLELPRLIGLAVGVLLSVLIIFISKKWRLQIFKIDFIFIAFLLWTLVGTLRSIDIGLALQTWFRYVFLFIVFVISRYFLIHEKQYFFKLIFRTIAFINLLNILLLGIAILQLPSCAVFEDLYSIHGLFGHKNLSASYFVFSIPLLLFYATQTFKTERIILWCTVVAQMGLVGFIESRAAILGLIVTGLSSIVLYNKEIFQKRVLHITIVVSIGILCAIFIKAFVFCGELFPQHDALRNPEIDTYYYNRFEEDRAILTSTAYERVELWKKTLDVIKEKPIIGVGLNNWRYAYSKNGLTGLVRSEVENVQFVSPHNDYLWLASETGIIGLAAYIIFILLICLPIVKKFKISTWYQKAALLTIIAVACNAMLDFPHQITSHAVVIFISLALLWKKRNHYLLITSKISVIFLFALFIFSFTFVLVFRMRGEKYSSLIVKELNANVAVKFDWCDKAYSPLFKVNSLAVPIQWYKGTFAAESGNKIKALRCFADAYEITPYNKMVVQDYATACYVNKDEKKAEMLYKKAIKISPMYDKARLNYSVLLINQSRLNEADETLQGVIDTTDTKFIALQKYLKETNTK